MWNEIKYQRSLLGEHEAVIRAKTEKIKELEEKISQQAEEICRLNAESMYASILFVY